MQPLRFTKMEGAGNDYVYVDAIHDDFDLARGAEVARIVADRRFGVGGDGLIVLAPSTVADVRMVMWNADGSRSSMCGNGIRCIAKLARDVGATDTDRQRVETDSGVRDVDLVRGDDGTVIGATVEMGDVTVELDPQTIGFGDQIYPYHPADVGNPHSVVFLDSEPTDDLVHGLGAEMQNSERFSDGVNVEFITVQPDGSLRQRTFERGSGETLACGSGATAAACAAVRLGLVAGPKVVVHLLGGDLDIECSASSAVMAGPARTVFSGEISLPIT
jgi:diaminopimelate epimerase